MTPAVLVLSENGASVARRAAQAIGGELVAKAGRLSAAGEGEAESAALTEVEDAPEMLRALFASGRPIVGICAAGILIRALAPLIAEKRAEPPVVAVSEDGGYVLPLLGGHRGANDLARALAEALGGAAALTTAGDRAFGVALDAPPPGWRLENPETAKSVMAAMLGGASAIVAGGPGWLAPLAENGRAARGPAGPGDHSLDVRLRVEGAADLVARARRLALGVGCARGAEASDLAQLVDRALSESGLSPAAIAGVFSLDRKADEPAIAALLERIDAPLRVFDAARLEAETPRLANPSEVVFAEVGTHGVAEAAALAGAGAGAELVVPKMKSETCTVAIAAAATPIVEPPGRRRGRLAVIGVGPGRADWRTPEASRLIAEAEELIGYGLYLELLGPAAVGKARRDFPLGAEEERCRYALEQAATGRHVALISSGDAGIYAMGALVMELLERPGDEGGVSDAARRVEIVHAPGITAMQAASARAGALLGHDFCAISLSDLLTPRETILERVKAAAAGDFVVAFYNPVSMRRRVLLTEAREILLAHRSADTPVVLATDLGRANERLRWRRLAALEVDEVDMLTTVLVGSSASRAFDPGCGQRGYTPRGYAAKRKSGG